MPAEALASGAEAGQKLAGRDGVARDLLAVDEDHGDRGAVAELQLEIPVDVPSGLKQLQFKLLLLQLLYVKNQ